VVSTGIFWMRSFRKAVIVSPTAELPMLQELFTLR
jgi:hypothetical protein